MVRQSPHAIRYAKTCFFFNSLRLSFPDRHNPPKQQTCRSLRVAISHSMQLQYELTLFSCGMRDGPRRDTNHAVQLERLLAHDAAWQKLAWTDARPFEHLAGSFHPAAVSGSTIAFIPFGPGPVSGFRLLIQQFPSALRGTEMRHWELQFQLMSVHDTLMDVSQDLLVLLEPDSLCARLFFLDLADLATYGWRNRSNYTAIYHVYSLSTGRPHPLAANEGLLEVPEGRTISGGASGLCGDYIGATAYSPSDKSTHLVFWNWKTGERRVDAVSVFVHLHEHFKLTRRGKKKKAPADARIGSQTYIHISRPSPYTRRLPLVKRVPITTPRPARMRARPLIAPTRRLGSLLQRRHGAAQHRIDVPLPHTQTTQTTRFLGDPHAPQLRPSTPEHHLRSTTLLRQRPRGPASSHRDGQPATPPTTR